MVASEYKLAQEYFQQFAKRTRSISASLPGWLVPDVLAFVGVFMVTINVLTGPSTGGLLIGPFFLHTRSAFRGSFPGVESAGFRKSEGMKSEPNARRSYTAFFKGGDLR